MKCIVATTIHGVIGRGNDIPWNLPVDMQRFKDLTKGHQVIMGSETYKSLSKPLSNRDHLILTRTPTDSFYSKTGNFIEFVDSDDLNHRDLSDSWLIGGQQVYSLLAHKVNELHVTLILDTFEGDVWFPWGCYTNFELVEKNGIRTAKNEIHYTFLKYKRK